VRRNRTATLLGGAEVNCIYDIDDDGFILLGVHGCETDLTSISEVEYDNLQRQCMSSEGHDDADPS